MNHHMLRVSRGFLDSNNRPYDLVSVSFRPTSCWLRGLLLVSVLRRQGEVWVLSVLMLPSFLHLLLSGKFLFLSLSSFLFFSFFIYFQNLETQEVFDHLVSFPSSRGMISRLGIEPPTTLFGLGTSPLSFGSLGSSQTFSHPFLCLNWVFPYSYVHCVKVSYSMFQVCDYVFQS